MEKLLTRKEAAKLLGISIDTLDAGEDKRPGFLRSICRERLRLLYGTKPSGIHSPVNAQSKAKGSQYRHDLQNSESSGTKVTSLI